MSLATFLANAAPNLQKKCSLQACGDTPAAHMVSYLHSKGLVSFSMTQLPEGKELPGGSEGQIWFWARPTAVCSSHPGCVSTVPAKQARDHE